MKRFEDADEIVVAIIDETYGGDERTYEYDSRQYKISLLQEFAHDFEDSNVGPGADIPAFVTVVRENVLPLLPWLMAVFFSGKPILDNLGAWQQIFFSVRRFFSRPLVLNRNGAAVIAVEAVFKEMGGTPRSLLLKSYRPVGIWEVGDFNKLSGLGLIENGPPILNLGRVFHLFEIEADGIGFLVGINGKEALVRRFPAPLVHPAQNSGDLGSALMSPTSPPG